MKMKDGLGGVWVFLGHESLNFHGGMGKILSETHSVQVYTDSFTRKLNAFLGMGVFHYQGIVSEMGKSYKLKKG